jgi:5-formyltetrahydrofolate cyclo-ligase
MGFAPIAEQKRALRREAIARRDALENRQKLSEAICDRLLGLPQFQAAPAIHCFLPIRSEVDTRPIVMAALAAGKAVAIPITMSSGPLQHAWIDSLDPDKFELGQFGTARPRTPRPAFPGDWKLTVVPLLAFDRRGIRLGYGKGYYDQLLAQAAGCAVGVAFAALELPNLPREPHDYPLDLTVTERELIASEA